MDWLYKIIDKSLLEMSKSDVLMMVPGQIPELMLDDTRDELSGWTGWKSIPSTITDLNIEKFELEIGKALPQSYKLFLKYKHFMNLNIPDKMIHFPGIVLGEELSFLKENISNILEPELIIGKGYIYFADFEDFGMLCFNTNVKAKNNEYPIVYIDNDNLEEIHLYADNFKALLEGDSEKGNQFIDYLNEYHLD